MVPPPKLVRDYLPHDEHFSFNVSKLLPIDLILNFNLNRLRTNGGLATVIRGDVASLVEVTIA